MATNKEIVNQINDAFANSDVESFLTHCTENVVWHMYGDQSIEGKENIRQFMKSHEGPSDPPVFVIDNVFGEGDRVACDGGMTMKTADGNYWKGRYCDLYIFEGGKVKEMRSYIVESKQG